MKIVFMGTPPAAASSLQRVVDDGHEVAAVYTQPDRPSGRGNKVVFSAVKQSAMDLGLEVRQPAKIKTEESINAFRTLNADLAVVVAYGRILPDAYLQAFSGGAVNVHFSLLPKYRGAAPVNWAIVNGETKTGVTTMVMDAGLDTGDILLQSETEIGPNENSIELMSRLSHMGADLLSATLSDLRSLSPVSQDDHNATFAPLMSKFDGVIDWNRSATDIARRVRGFQPFPSAHTIYRGGLLKIWDAEPLEVQGSLESGTIVAVEPENLIFACGSGEGLKVHILQPEGKKRMSSRDFVNGIKPRIGEALGIAEDV